MTDNTTRGGDAGFCVRAEDADEILAGLPLTATDAAELRLLEEPGRRRPCKKRAAEPAGRRVSSAEPCRLPPLTGSCRPLPRWIWPPVKVRD